MIKGLEQIRKKSADLYVGYPERLAELEAQLTGAEQDLKEAQAAQAAADTLEAYDTATAAVDQAKDRVKFAQIAVNELKGASRMSESEYMSAVNTCRSIMIKATEEYRKTAFTLMNQLKAQYDKYMETAADVTGTLSALDDAANILQTRHANRIVHLQDAPDPSEWERHALRYYPADAARLATESGDPRQPHDSVLAAAWKAINRAYPHRNF